MSSLHEVEEHPWTFPLMLGYSILITGCLFYHCCKNCCSKSNIIKSMNPKITLSSA